MRARSAADLIRMMMMSRTGPSVGISVRIISPVASGVLSAVQYCVCSDILLLCGVPSLILERNIVVSLLWYFGKLLLLGVSVENLQVRSLLCRVDPLVK